MKVVCLGSGSSGNSIAVQHSDGTTILVDCGLPINKLEKRMHEVGWRMHGVHSVLISHGHVDHNKSAELLKKRWEIPNCILLPNGWCPRGPFIVRSFPVPHDAEVAVGYRIQEGERVLTTIIDAGCITPVMVEAMQGAHVIAIECNHDEDLLANGSYKPEQKERIASNTGHLSTQQVSQFIIDDWDGLAHTICLLHLSEKNNTPELARATAQAALDSRGSSASIVVSGPNSATPVIEV